VCGRRCERTHALGHVIEDLPASSGAFILLALTVLVVFTALDLLHSGRAGVGYINAALGVVALFGAAGVLALILSGGPPPASGSGSRSGGLPVAIVGSWPNRYAALFLFACVGVGNSIVDISLLTLLQRAVPDAVLARVFGILESLMLATVATGAVVAPALIAAIGIRWSLAAAGLLLPLLAARLATAQRDRRRSRRARTEERALLERVPILSSLPPLVLEQLATHLRRVELPAHATVFEQGESGDRFYIAAAGTLQLTVDGRAVRTLGPGDFFGEIALLRSEPRTGTIVTTAPTTLYALEGDDFVAAVTGHPPSLAAADAAVATRLTHVAPGVT
jgi:hypothetical protein